MKIYSVIDNTDENEGFYGFFDTKKEAVEYVKKYEDTVEDDEFSLANCGTVSAYEYDTDTKELIYLCSCVDGEFGDINEVMKQ